MTQTLVWPGPDDVVLPSLGVDVFAGGELEVDDDLVDELLGHGFAIPVVAEPPTETPDDPPEEPDTGGEGQ